jgi:hypothetical protein
MRYTITASIVLGFLAANLPRSDGKAISRDWLARDKSISRDWVCPDSPYAYCPKTGDHEIAGPEDIYPSAGGGGGRGGSHGGGSSGGGESSDGGGSSGGDGGGGSTEQGLGYQSSSGGSEQGFGEDGSGGTGARQGGDTGTFVPNPAYQKYQASTRNNNLAPATKQTTGRDRTWMPKAPYEEIDVGQLATDLRQVIQAQNRQGGPFLFYSGTEGQAVLDFKKNMNLISPENNILYIGDVMRHEDITLQTKYEEDSEMSRYFWACYSRAYAQAVSGKVYVVMPSDRTINRPSNPDPSIWWSYEAPDLSLNPDVTEIVARKFQSATYDSQDEVYKGWEDERVIFTQGDEPLGYVNVDSHFYEPTLPTDDWDG